MKEEKLSVEKLQTGCSSVVTSVRRKGKRLACQLNGLSPYILFLDNQFTAHPFPAHCQPQCWANTNELPSLTLTLTLLRHMSHQSEEQMQPQQYEEQRHPAATKANRATRRPALNLDRDSLPDQKSGWPPETHTTETRRPKWKQKLKNKIPI